MEEENKAINNDVEAIFACDIETEASQLMTKKNYVEFAKQMANVLYDGQSPYNIPFFFQALLAELPTKSGCDAKQIK